MQKSIIKPRFLVWAGVVITVLLVAIYIGVAIYGANTFNKNTNRPLDYRDDNPSKYGLAYQDVNFTSASPDGTKLNLSGWWIPNPNSDQTLVVVHGHNANRLRHLALSKPLWDKGFNLLYFDLQGQGTSQGERYYFGQHEQYDVVAAFNFVKSKGFAPSKIGVLSFSMGASAALLSLSHSPDIKVVVSDSAYADFEKMAEFRFTHDTGLPQFFLPGILVASRVMYGLDVNQTKPVLTLPTVTSRRIYLIHGTADTDVPIDSFYSLQKAGGSNIVDSWVVSGAKHVESFDMYPQEYISRVSTFFKQELTTN